MRETGSSFQYVLGVSLTAARGGFCIVKILAIDFVD
jgi:hypothetical protein